MKSYWNKQAEFSRKSVKGVLGPWPFRTLGPLEGLRPVTVNESCEQNESCEPH